MKARLPQRHARLKCLPTGSGGTAAQEATSQNPSAGSQGKGARLGAGKVPDHGSGQSRAQLTAPRADGGAAGAEARRPTTASTTGHGLCTIPANTNAIERPPSAPSGGANLGATKGQGSIKSWLALASGAAGKLPHSAEDQGGKSDDRSTGSRGQQECPDPDRQGTLRLPGLRPCRNAECGANPSAGHLQGHHQAAGVDSQAKTGDQISCLKKTHGADDKGGRTIPARDLESRSTRLGSLRDPQPDGSQRGNSSGGRAPPLRAHPTFPSSSGTGQGRPLKDLCLLNHSNHCYANSVVTVLLHLHCTIHACATAELDSFLSRLLRRSRKLLWSDIAWST